MPCQSCGVLRSGAVQAIRRGQIGTAAAIVAKGAAQVAASAKAPSITAAIRKR